MTFAIVESVSGAASAAAMNPATVSGGRGQDQQPAQDLLDGVQPQLEPRHDAEVAAAAADRPEEIGVRRGVDPQQLPVRGHDVRGEQRVDGHAEGAHEEADAAAERDPAEPDRAGVAEPGREAVLADLRRVLDGGQPGAGPRGPALDVDLELVEVAQVDDEPVVDDAVAGAAVAAAPDGQREAGLARDAQDLGDVGGVRDADDGQWPAVDAARHDLPGGVVAGVVGGDDRAAHDGAEVVDRVGGSERGRHGGILPNPRRGQVADTQKRRAGGPARRSWCSRRAT